MNRPHGESVCPFRSGDAVLVCDANGFRVPGIESRKKFCEGQFKKCPLYRKWIRRASRSAASSAGVTGSGRVSRSSHRRVAA